MNRSFRLCVVVWVSAVTLVANARGDEAQPVPAVKSPLSTDQALSSFVLASPDLKLELVAAEPEVVSPVAIAFGDDGSMWVVEMRDYPYGPKPGSTDNPLSRIKHLFDKNQDGRFETASIFVEGLLFPTGVLPWKDGIIVTLAGEIAFFADRDGDGLAEFKETWFTGFVQENSQLRANHPTLGPDGWVYVANGLRGGTIVAAKPEWKTKGQPVALAGFDFRFNPSTGESAAVSGNGQYGLCFDDYGNRFVCSNRNPVQHVVLEDQYIRRNPFLAVKKAVHDVAPYAEFSKLHPISKAWTTSTLHANQFTAACGVQIYRGDALPPEFVGNAFTCDPTGNLVHREVLTPTGATFTGNAADGDQEFLASPDTWFRPVDLVNGPDGALYVVDMYRAVIEHPDWMPAEMKTRKDLHDGSDRGRIWRVMSIEPTVNQERPDEPIAKLSTKDVIELLEHRNGWHRDTAMRILLERNPHEVLDALKNNWKQNRLTRSRLRVLWMLKILDPRLTPAVLAWSETKSRDARVREQVISAIGDNLDELLGSEQAMDLVDDEADERVRFRLALDLSGRSEDAVFERKLLVRLLDHGAEDPWLRIAVATMRCNPPELLIVELLDHWQMRGAIPDGAADLIEELSEVAGAQMTPTAATAYFNALLAFDAPTLSSPAVNDIQLAGLRGLGQGTTRRGIILQTYFEQMGEAERGLISHLVSRALETIIDAEVMAPRRIATIKTLRFLSGPEVATALLDLALSDEEISLKLTALESLGASHDPIIGTRLLEAFDVQTPQFRRAILDVLLADEVRTKLLLDALESSTLKPTEVDVTRQSRLTKHKNAEIKQRATKLFTDSASPDRNAIMMKYQPALEQKADAARGRLIFEKNCVTCHRVANVGTNVGPDIGDTRDKTPAYLLTNILDPNRAVDANYFGYTLVTKQGRVLTGLVKSETASSITIRLPEGKEETILRTDVDELKSSGLSLMPIGLEKTITVDQMADLISYLKNWRYLDGTVPLAE
ncbi:MAG TPA: PVC-type heme-binding CxxCH protein [Schlesneria sp.]